MALRQVNRVSFQSQTGEKESQRVNVKSKRDILTVR